MLLNEKFYTIAGVDRIDDQHATYHISLLADCDVYRGHFPGKPVCPGVCEIETLKECVMHMTGKNLSITTVKQCRFTAVASPEKSLTADITISLEPIEEGGYKVQATWADAETSYMDFKGEMKP